VQHSIVCGLSELVHFLCQGIAKEVRARRLGSTQNSWSGRRESKPRSQLGTLGESKIEHLRNS
jgi:hypothetical protein